VALLDKERDVVVIRVVYDGPPEAGKTTSLRALAGSLHRPLYCPEEQGGRTLYFDWMDYTAGRFEGRPIRCQIVSVPGQRSFHERRRRLLREADAVVFVADTTRRGLESTLIALAQLPRALEGVGGPPIGMVLQANKRDLPDAVPRTELADRLEGAGWRMAVTESVAADGTGVRETFIFAVRLALDRARELVRTRKLAEGRPELDSGEELLAHMKRFEADRERAADDWAGPALQQILAENLEPKGRAPLAARRAAARPALADEPPPRPPDATVPSGAIWPPVEGRMILHEAVASGLTSHRLQNGDWAAGLGSGWRACTRHDAVYRGFAEGRAALLEWARLHAACARLLSPRRCLTLADAGDRTWRLWQLVRSERSLRDLTPDLDRRSAEAGALELLGLAGLLVELEGRVAEAGYHLPCTLDSVGRGVDGPVFIGLMPAAAPAEPTARRGQDLLAEELGPLVATLSPPRRRELAAALERVRGRAARASRAVVGWVRDLLEPDGAALSPRGDRGRSA
jgi:signal recognition particle receptor subunit beta